MKLLLSIIIAFSLLSCSGEEFLGGSKSNSTKIRGGEDGGGGVPQQPQNSGDQFGSPNGNGSSSENQGETGPWGDSSDQDGNYGSDSGSGKDGRDVELTGYDNTIVATSAKSGKMIVSFAINNMASTDTNVAIDLSLHTVDFENVTMASIDKQSYGDKVGYKAKLEITYKSVPDVTKYKNQQYKVTYKDKDGKSETITGKFHMVVRPEGKTSSDPVATELEGTAGHPNN